MSIQACQSKMTRLTVSIRLAFLCVNVPQSTQSYDDWVVQAVLRLSIAATSMPEYFSGWCEYGFKAFSLTYPYADLSLRHSVFCFWGLSVKGVRSISDILWTRGDSSDADVRTFCCKRKNVKFFENYSVHTLKGTLIQCRLCRQKLLFCDFVRTSFMDSPPKLVVWGREAAQRSSDYCTAFSLRIKSEIIKFSLHNPVSTTFGCHEWAVHVSAALCQGLHFKFAAETKAIAKGVGRKISVGKRQWKKDRK